tara:strand:+ start:776 stop:1906 length:1131 start_codon:yes stop_codon:yes gene_type:complete
MRHLDLFSGIGGFALGLEATQKIKTVAFCEIDKYCTKVLNKNWPEVPVYKDIKELTYDKLKADGIDSIDIITGGYPCQPFSIAGLKKGVEDPRHLWPEYFRIIKELRPTWVIGENVSGHIKLGLDAVQEDLESQGYSLRTFSVSASSIGANHQRERIWTVAYSQRNYDSQQIKRVNGEEISLQKEHRENDSTTRNSSGASAIRETRNEHADVVHSNSFRSPQHTEATEETSRRGTETSFVSTSDVENARRRSWREQFTRDTESTGPGTSEKTEWSTNTDTSPGPSERTETMANASSIESNVGEDIQHTSTGNGQGQTGRENSSEESAQNWWNLEPDVGRVADGVPDRTHRLKSLGNAVVPQIPYYIAQSILEVMNA